MRIASYSSFKNLIKNSSMMFFLNLFSTAVSFFSIPITLKIMGITTYGNMIFVQSIASAIFTLTTIQYWQGLLIELPGKNIDNKVLKKILKKSFAYELYPFFFTCFTILALSFFNLKQFQPFSITNLILIIIPLFSAFGTFTSYFRLIDKYNLLMILGLITNSIRLLLLLYVSKYLQPTFDNVILSYAIPEFLKSMFIILHFFTKNAAIYGTSPDNIVDKKRIQQAGKWGMIQSIFDLPISQVDKIIIGSALPGSELGIFNVFKKLYGILNMATGPFYTTSIQEFSLLINNNDIKGSLELFKRTTFILFFVVSTISLLTYLSKSIWIRFVLKDLVDYPFELNTILLTATIAGTFICTHSLYWSLGKTKKTTLITIIANLLYLFLLYYFSLLWGFKGAVLSFLFQVTFTVLVKLIMIGNIYKRII